MFGIRQYVDIDIRDKYSEFCALLSVSWLKQGISKHLHLIIWFTMRYQFKGWDVFLSSEVQGWGQRWTEGQQLFVKLWLCLPSFVYRLLKLLIREYKVQMLTSETSTFQDQTWHKKELSATCATLSPKGSHTMWKSFTKTLSSMEAKCLHLNSRNSSTQSDSKSTRG